MHKGKKEQQMARRRQLDSLNQESKENIQETDYTFFCSDTGFEKSIVWDRKNMESGWSKFRTG